MGNEGSKEDTEKMHDQFVQIAVQLFTISVCHKFPKVQPLAHHLWEMQKG